MKISNISFYHCSWFDFRYLYTFKAAENLNFDERKTMYQNTWKDSLIPICTNSSDASAHDCYEFQPSLTNLGMCLTKNLAPIHDIFQDTLYLRTFYETFLSDRNNFTIIKINANRLKFKDSFLIDSHRIMDLRSGLQWNNSKKAVFQISMQHNFDMPSMRETSVKIYAGYKTTLRVNAIQLKTDLAIKNLDIDKRKCKFSFEFDGLSLFKSYSRYFGNSILYSVTQKACYIFVLVDDFIQINKHHCLRYRTVSW